MGQQSVGCDVHLPPGIGHLILDGVQVESRREGHANRLVEAQIQVRLVNGEPVERRIVQDHPGVGGQADRSARDGGTISPAGSVGSIAVRPPPNATDAHP